VPALPVKPEYGPTLGRLLAPRWRRASVLVRRGATTLAILLAGAVVIAVRTLENAHYSRATPVPFSLSYRDLWRAAPEPGGYMRIVRRHSDGRLADSLAAGPLELPPYSGELAGALPLDATVYLHRLRARFRGFVLRGEGKTKVNGMISAYDIFFTANVENREMYGRDVLVLPERSGAREGVELLLLTTPGRSSGNNEPEKVGTAGVLFRPLKSLRIG
jgi:hypothetical protein